MNVSSDRDGVLGDLRKSVSAAEAVEAPTPAMVQQPTIVASTADMISERFTGGMVPPFWLFGSWQLKMQDAILAKFEGWEPSNRCARPGQLLFATRSALHVMGMNWFVHAVTCRMPVSALM